MIRLLDRYLLKEIVPYVALGFVLLTAIIFAQQASRFSELLVMSSRNGYPMEGVGRILSALIPGIVVITLPISLLIGTLVGLGRLSGDSEMIAMGASGVSRYQMLRPIFALASLVTVAMVFLTFSVMPRAIRNLRDLKGNHSVLFQGLKTQIKPRVFDESIPNKVLYVENIDRAANTWRGIFLADLSDRDHPKIFTASSGFLGEGEKPDTPELELVQASIHSMPQAGAPQPGPPPAGKEERSEAKQAAKRKAPPGEPYSVTRADQMEIPLGFSQQNTAEQMGLGVRQNTPSEMTWSELMAYSPAPGEYRSWKAEIHERIAFPAACLVFAVLGVAFGISHVRTGRPLGLLLGLAITIVYYLLALSGKHWAIAGTMPIGLGIWIGNIVLLAIGGTALFLQRKPGADALSALGGFLHIVRARRIARRQADASTARERPKVRPGLAVSNTGESPSLTRFLRRYQLIDRLVLSDLARYFIYILSGFTALFMIITVFQLLDQITRNNIESLVVVDYLLFLTPMIVNYMAPLAALVSVMVTFGLLEKTSQVVVLKASGLSIFRLATPALLCSVLLSSVVFLNQDYVLPFTNRRQDDLYHLIRSGQEPPQTFYQTDNKWIFGNESRIYYYSHFDPIENEFARLTVLDLSENPFGITSRIFASRAVWDPSSETWILERGWFRRFDGDKQTFEAFDRRSWSAAERPEYFKRSSRESSMMTLAELSKNIRDLSRSGFDVLDLRIDLYKKIAFPLTCLVMMLVGLPFAFSVGKRGALYGVTLGIAIGLFYWGLLGLFEQMGRYEVLPPLLAAWGPNIMFGTGGLYLFFTTRT